MSDLAVYDGQIRVAVLRDAGRGNVILFRVDQAGRKTKLGKYETRTLALRAVAKLIPSLPPAVPTTVRHEHGARLR